MWQVGQKVRIKSIDNLRDIGLEPSGSASYLAGKIGTIERVENDYVVLDIEKILRGRQGGIWFREIEPVDPIVTLMWNLTLKQGHAYEIKCTEEAIKELCEFVGDDALASINPIETKA